MKNRIKYNCKRCEKEFLAKRNRKNVTWCSKNCRSLDEKGKIFSKEHRERLSKALIGKKKSPQHIRNIVISRGDRTGERASNWKGGITKISICIRSSKKYKEWREQVFKLDDWTCQWCGARSGKGKKVFLHVHHIKPFSLILRHNNIHSVEEAMICEELWLIANGQTLCEKCHSETDSFKGKSNKYEN